MVSLDTPPLPPTPPRDLSGHVAPPLPARSAAAGAGGGARLLRLSPAGLSLGLFASRPLTWSIKAVRAELWCLSGPVSRPPPLSGAEGA